MEKKLMEKRAMLDVLDLFAAVESNWTVDGWKNEVKEWEDLTEEEKNDGNHGWTRDNAMAAQARLDALEVVKKHLEKLL